MDIRTRPLSYRLNRIRQAALAGLLAALSTSAAWADEYPSRPIRIVVPYPPGGTTDLITRVVAKGLNEAWKQPVVIENRGGASGMIGTDIVAKAANDGYTLLSTGSGPHVVNVSLFSKISHDPVKDFEPVSMMITIPLLMVAPADATYSTVPEFIRWARQNPGKANYCSIGPGSPSHLAAELFKSMAKVDLTYIPYKGSGPAIIDTIGGVCPVLFDSAVSSGAQVRTGKLKVLAIGTSERVTSWKEVPTVAEAGVPGFNAYTWGAMLAPAGTPRPVVDKLNKEIVRILDSAEVREMLASQGADPGKGTPADLASFTNQEIAKWAKVIKDGNIQAE